MGRAIVRGPQVFLFDEPLSNLDAAARRQCARDRASSTSGSAPPRCYVTHDQVEAMTLADRIVVLREGARAAGRHAARDLHAPANRFVAGFLGTPAMNFLAADVRADGGRTAARGPRFELPLASAPTDRVIVGIRPEAVGLTRRADAVAVPAEVAMREVLGAEVLLHVTSPAGELTLRTDAPRPAPGDRLTVYLDSHAVHLFDARSELRL